MTKNRFMIGVVLIASSSVVGWIAAGLGGALAVRYGSVAPKIGGAIWLFTWIPMGIGVWLSGKEGLKYSKEFLSKIFRKS